MLYIQVREPDTNVELGKIVNDVESGIQFIKDLYKNDYLDVDCIILCHTLVDEKLELRLEIHVANLNQVEFKFITYVPYSPENLMWYANAIYDALDLTHEEMVVTVFDATDPARDTKLVSDKEYKKERIWKEIQ